jgi:hypothetical protein
MALVFPDRTHALHRPVAGRSRAGVHFRKKTASIAEAGTQRIPSFKRVDRDRAIEVLVKMNFQSFKEQADVFEKRAVGGLRHGRSNDGVSGKSWLLRKSG